MNTFFVILMAPSGGSPLAQFLPILLIGVVFYFFMIRPQAKKLKDQKIFIESLKKGDKVVTIGGIHGKLSEIHDDYFVIEVDANVKLKVERSSVSMEASKNLNKN